MVNCGAVYYNAVMSRLLIQFGIAIWFFIFYLLVLLRLDKIIKLLERK